MVDKKSGKKNLSLDTSALPLGDSNISEIGSKVLRNRYNTIHTFSMAGNTNEENVECTCF